MELQNWIQSSDYINEFKRNHVTFRKYPDNDLMIIKRKFGSDYSEDKFWLNYCRGLVINYKTNNVVFIPPMKSREVQTIEQLHQHSSSPVNLVDGTMVNLFNVNNQWLTSTRSNIGCTNQWNQGTNFSEMFDQCSQSLKYDSLNKEFTYSFVMRHKKNRLTSVVKANELVLVEVYHKLQRLNDLPTNEGYLTINEWIPDELTKGLTLYKDNIRYKWLTIEHKFIEMIKPNTNNPCLNYLTLRNSGHLTSYLKIFPEKRFEFNKYREKLHNITVIIYQYYTGVFIHKQIDKKDIPFALKPLLYEIHGLYLKDKQGISWERVKQYMYDLDPKRLQFVINNL